MKNLVSFIVLSLGLLAAAGCTMNKTVLQSQDLKTEDDKTLYFIGKMISRNLKQFNLTPAEGKFVIMGFSDAVSGKKAKVDDSYAAKVNDFVMRKQAEAAKKEKDAAKVYVEKMEKTAGAVKTASGLVYIEMKKGDGASPKAEDTVKVHYHGTLIDGKVFDSSVERQTPAEFPLDRVIPCWTEGVQKMQVGGKAKLVCPSDIAYGDSGIPGVIPGGTALTFEVELLEIMKPEPAEAPAQPEVKKEEKKDAKPAEKKAEPKK